MIPLFFDGYGATALGAMQAYPTKAISSAITVKTLLATPMQLARHFSYWEGTVGTILHEITYQLLELFFTKNFENAQGYWQMEKVYRSQGWHWLGMTVYL